MKTKARFSIENRQTLQRTVTRCPDPIAAFRALTGDTQTCGTALLETAETPEQALSAGKSLIVARSALRVVCHGTQVEATALNANGDAVVAELAQRFTHIDRFTADAGRFSCTFAPIAGGSEEERLKAASPVDVLRALLEGLGADADQQSAVPLIVGTFAYDLLECYEPLPPSREDLLHWPNFEFWLPDQIVWLDHQRGVSTVVFQLFGASQDSAAYGEAVSTLVRTVETIEQTQRIDAEMSTPAARAQVASSPASDMDDDAYATLVQRVKEHIVAGDVFQIVPSRTFSMDCPQPLEAYRQLRYSNPSPYMFYMCGGEGVLFGTSPETAVEVSGDPLEVHIRPIAGTRPRGRYADGTPDADLDSRLEAELRLNEKEVAEHMMLVDLARNDVARVSETGTRRVSEMLQVHRYSHVMHLLSHVIGRLRDDLDALHAYVATMNMGTLVGAPKVRAAQLLREYEATRRGPYGGAVGYVTADGRMDTGIVIRSAVVKAKKAYVRAGAGVVYDSDPMAEADETRRKAQAVLNAIARAHARDATN